MVYFLSSRLTVEAPKQHQEELRLLEKEAEEDLRRLRREGRDRRMGHKSLHLATQHQRRALSEVFDVLLATVLYTKHAERRQQLHQQQHLPPTTISNSNDSSFSVDIEEQEESQQGSRSDDNAPPLVSNALPSELSLALTDIQSQSLQRNDAMKKGVPPSSQFANSPVRRTRFPMGPKTASPRDSLLYRAKLSRDAGISNNNSSNSNVSSSDYSLVAALGGADAPVGSSQDAAAAVGLFDSFTQSTSARDPEGHAVVAMSSMAAESSSSTRLKMKVTMSIAPHAAGDSDSSPSLPTTVQRKVHLQTVHNFLVAGNDDNDSMLLQQPDEDGLSMGGLVDLRLAMPSLLQPRAMAFAVTVVLRAAQEDRVQLVSEGLLPADRCDLPPPPPTPNPITWTQKIYLLTKPNNPTTGVTFSLSLCP